MNLLCVYNQLHIYRANILIKLCLARVSPGNMRWDVFSLCSVATRPPSFFFFCCIPLLFTFPLICDAAAGLQRRLLSPAAGRRKENNFLMFTQTFSLRWKVYMTLMELLHVTCNCNTVSIATKIILIGPDFHNKTKAVMFIMGIR